MKVLVISNCAVTIDIEDYPLLSRYNWYVKHDKYCSYVVCDVWLNKKRCKLYMHRLIMGMRKGEYDHINRNALDNRKENLRICTRKQNVANRNVANKFGFRGVTRYKGTRDFIARIVDNGTRVTIGKFKTKEEAARAFDKKAKELHGEFACLNFKEDSPCES